MLATNERCCHNEWCCPHILIPRGSLTNAASASIARFNEGVAFKHAGTVVNSGSIAGTRGYGIYRSSGGSVTNAASASITGGNAAPCIVSRSTSRSRRSFTLFGRNFVQWLLIFARMSSLIAFSPLLQYRLRQWENAILFRKGIFPQGVSVETAVLEFM
jgi:hypothetical protein